VLCREHTYLSFSFEVLMRENEYQASLIKRINALLPGCTVLKNDCIRTVGLY